MRLELGSGYNPTDGFAHLDLNPNAPHVEYRAAAWPLSFIGDGTVEELRAVDVLEHISYWHTEAVLADWARVMEHGARLYVQVPDARTIMHWYVEAPRKLIRRMPPDLPQTALVGAAWRLLGGHSDGIAVKADDDWRLNAHYALFDTGYLTAALARAGLMVERLTINEHPNICATAVKR